MNCRNPPSLFVHTIRTSVSLWHVFLKPINIICMTLVYFTRTDRHLGPSGGGLHQWNQLMIIRSGAARDEEDNYTNNDQSSHRCWLWWWNRKSHTGDARYFTAGTIHYKIITTQPVLAIFILYLLYYFCD